ncbi:MAG TPA: hypothetical protein PK718_01630 [Candidatus Methanofastidiosa archaeon]|nr:hypothetical protein [Candidatus Methanofastidiosa archaeon]
MDTDVLHEPNSEPEWNESFYFSFYDKDNDSYAFMRMGLRPNKKEKNMFCYISTPHIVAGKRAYGHIYHNGMETNGLKYEKLEAEKRWKMTYEGDMKVVSCKTLEYIDVKLDLEFNALNDMFDYRKCVTGPKEMMSRSVASEHYEQFGRVTGKIEMLEKTLEIDGLGERDHSWGVRDWNAPRMWIWLTGQFSEKLALNVTKLIVDEGEVDAGFFHVDGTDHPIIGANIDTVFGDDGAPESFTMELTDAEGRVRSVDAKVIKNIKLPFMSEDKKTLSVMHETLAEYTYDGKKGYGIAEYLIKNKRE